MKVFFNAGKTIGKPITALVFLVVFITSCDYSYLDGVNNIEEYTYKPVFAVPLIDSKIGIDDIIDVDDFNIIEVDENDLISLVYRGNIFSVKARDIFTVPDQNQTITISNITPSGSGSTTLPAQSYVYTLSFERDEILTAISFLAANLNIVAVAPQLVADGYSVSASFRVLNSTAPGGGPISGVVSTRAPTNMSLAGCSIETGNQGNFFLIEYTITISGNGTPNQAPYTLSLIHSVSNIRYDLLRGYIDKIDFPIGEAIVPLTVFQNVSNGNFSFENPSINFNITNNFGLPIDLQIYEFFARMGDGREVDITGTLVDNPWRILHPANPGGPGVVTTQNLSNENTNLFSVTGQAPREVVYNVRGLTNPGPFTQANNWIKHDSDLSIEMEVKLPLHGRVDFFNFKDTIDLTFDFIPDEIDWLEMNLRFENGFPLEVDLKLVLYDEFNQPVDTLFSEYTTIMQPAPVNPSTGLVTQPAITGIKEMFDRESVINLKNAAKIVAEVNMNSYQSQNQVAVKILESYKLGLQLGARVKGNVVIDPQSGN